MAREIKFRVWAETDDVEAEMIYLDKGEFDNGLWFEAPKHLDRYKATMQFTGLQDKNGVDIYEGDLLETADGVLLVIWHEQMATFGLRKNGWMFTHFFGETLDPKDSKCVGNIYMTPELLNTGGDGKG